MSPALCRFGSLSHALKHRLFPTWSREYAGVWQCKQKPRQSNPIRLHKVRSLSQNCSMYNQSLLTNYKLHIDYYNCMPPSRQLQRPRRTGDTRARRRACGYRTSTSSCLAAAGSCSRGSGMTSYVTPYKLYGYGLYSYGLYSYGLYGLVTRHQ